MKYSELPERVQERALPQDDIGHESCISCGEGLYWVDIEDDETCPMCGMHYGSGGEPLNSWGGRSHAEHVGDGLYLTADGEYGVMCLGCYENMDYHPDGTIVVAADEKYKTTYMNGVYYNPAEWPPFDAPPDWVYDVFDGVAGGTERKPTDAWRGANEPPDEAGGFTNVSSGWHSSMEKSDLSERINDLTDGRMPFPVVVVFGRTSNVCSMGIDVYAPEEHSDRVEDYLDVRAAPGHAGVR